MLLLDDGPEIRDFKLQLCSSNFVFGVKTFLDVFDLRAQAVLEVAHLPLQSVLYIVQAGVVDKNSSGHGEKAHGNTY